MLDTLAEKNAYCSVFNHLHFGPTEVRVTVFIVNQYAVSRDRLYTETIQQRMIEHVDVIIRKTTHS